MDMSLLIKGPYHSSQTTNQPKGGIPQLSVGGGRIMERSARSESKTLEDCGALLHGGEALLSLVMLIIRKRKSGGWCWAKQD